MFLLMDDGFVLQITRLTMRQNEKGCNMFNLVHSVSEIEKFHSFLHPLQIGEAYFVSMSARDKYLTAEEREHFSLGRSEMFGRKIVKYPSFADYLRVIRSMEVNDGGYTTRNGLSIPHKCAVIYANINASSGIKALHEFNQRTNDLMLETLSNKDAFKHYASLDSILMNCFQRQRGTKHLLDVDFDVKKDPEGHALLGSFIGELKKNNVTYKVIETHGGFHVLLVRNTLKFNYYAVIKKLDETAKELYGKAEIVKNVNDMVPLPGTMQAGFPVKFLEV